MRRKSGGKDTIYTSYYDSPLGRILLSANEKGLTGLWFCGQKYFAAGLEDERCEKKNGVIADAEHWLDIYFSSSAPDFTPPLDPSGTDFQRSVWKMLLNIPYGQTTTYGELAKRLAEKMGRRTLSAQAVGGAVGHNKISIIIPCHRVIGANGSLTGYAGGIARKIKLLELEK